MLITERHEAGRIDRQLAGRTARQGDPGSVAAILAADDPLLNIGGTWPRAVVRLAQCLPGASVRQSVAAWALRRAQRGLEHNHATVRHALLRQDRLRSERLGFAGVGE